MWCPSAWWAGRTGHGPGATGLSTHGLPSMSSHGHSGPTSRSRGGVASEASPGAPPHPSHLNLAQLPTQGPHFAPTTRGHCGCGLFPPKGTPSQERPRASVRASGSRACGQEAFITTWTDTAVRDRPSPPGHWGRSCVDSPPASQGADSVTQEKTGEPSNEARDLGCLLYKPKEMYT